MREDVWKDLCTKVHRYAGAEVHKSKNTKVQRPNFAEAEMQKCICPCSKGQTYLYQQYMCEFGAALGLYTALRKGPRSKMFDSGHLTISQGLHMLDIRV